MNALLLTVLALVAMPQLPQAIDGAGIFDKGKPYEEFLAAADARPEVWKANTNRAHPSSELVDRLKKAGSGLRFVVVATAPCSDSVHTVPYVAALAREAGVPLRVVDPALGKPIQDAFKTPDGRGATPTVAILRGDKVVAAWVERPVALQTWMLGPAAALSSADRMDRKFGWYEWDRGESTIAELVDLVERHK
ncbi:MAG TPA: thioredoxin family protein [Vicinamibacterales bacterium]|nr:thioredoxin family protein [Vicinamibacterales bacterium]